LSDKKPKSRPEPGKDQPGGAPDQEAGPMSVGFLQQLVAIMAANDLSVVDLKEGDRRIRLRRGSAAATQYVMSAPAMPMMPQSPANLPAVTTTGSPPVSAGAKDEDAGLIPIRSPMVGTFYSKPSPDAKPFVDLGSPVVKDETEVCVIEAMKNFNTIKSDVTGTIVRVLMQDGQTVDVNKPLFLVKPS
jgi:acetyl-CoA carboxylase biotin carboxyl carrier protein